MVDLLGFHRATGTSRWRATAAGVLLVENGVSKGQLKSSLHVLPAIGPWKQRCVAGLDTSEGPAACVKTGDSVKWFGVMLAFGNGPQSSHISTEEQPGLGPTTQTPHHLSCRPSV